MLTYIFTQINTSSQVADSLSNSTSEPAEKTLSIIEMTTSGGFGGIVIMLSLLVLSIIAVYIFIERYITIKKAAEEDINFMNEIKDFIQDESYRSIFGMVGK